MTNVVRDELTTSSPDSIPKQSQTTDKTNVSIIMSTKECGKCHKIRNISYFYTDKYTKDGYRCCCTVCSKKYDSTPKSVLSKKNYQESMRGKEMKDKYHYSPEGIYAVIKSSARRRNLSCNINREEFILWYNNQEKLCHYCNKTEKDALNDMNRKMKRLSIDRKDNSIGYQLDNIVLACYKCNMIKSNDISYEKMLNIGGILKNE